MSWKAWGRAKPQLFPRDWELKGKGWRDWMPALPARGPRGYAGAAHRVVRAKGIKINFGQDCMRFLVCENSRVLGEKNALRDLATHGSAQRHRGRMGWLFQLGNIDHDAAALVPSAQGTAVVRMVAPATVGGRCPWRSYRAREVWFPRE